MIVFVFIAVALLIIAVGWTVLPLVRGPIMAAVATVLLIVAALGLYLYYGTPDALFLQSATDQRSDSAANVQSIEQLITGIHATLSKSPDDVQAWLLLGRSYVSIGRLDDALNTYRKAHAALGNHPDLLADWVEVEARVHDNLFTPAVAQRIQDILIQYPDHSKALWLGGFAALQAGDKPLALERWRRLRAQQQPDSDSARLINQLISQVAPIPTVIDAESTDPVQVDGAH